MGKELDELKHADMREILDCYGIPYEQQSDGPIVFSIRKEQSPSCFAEIGRKGFWIWHDFGTGEGGNLIDFLMKLEATTDIPELIRRTASLPFNQGNLPTSQAPPSQVSPAKGKESQGLPTSQAPPPTSKGWRIIRTIPAAKVTNKLKDMVQTHRGITPNILDAVPLFLVTLATPSGKKVSKWGVKNVMDGWELFDAQTSQNGGLKLSIGRKHISELVPMDPQKRSVIVAESVWDALAAMKLRGEAGHGLVSLNGVTQAQKFLDLAASVKPHRVILALDQDDAGKEAQRLLQQGLERIGTEALVLPYDGKDPSEALLKRMQDKGKDPKLKGKETVPDIPWWGPKNEPSPWGF